ncbi:MAG: type II secretion system F family protein [Kiritimatiellae bacterium]|nr:type II secretion system F family protein [Kiritimatiellia bacterium]
MIEWALVALFGIAVFCAVWFLLSGIKVKTGWQNESGFIARFLDSRRRQKFNDQLPQALSTMSNALRAGFSISQAFDSVVELGVQPISEEFDILQRQLRVGMGFDEALESMASRVGSEDFVLVTGAISISRKTGGNVTEIFDKISETIRARMKVARRVRSLTAQGRMQGIIVSAMPVFLGVALTLLKPKMMIPFLCSFVGIVSVFVMFGLIAVGWFFISKIIKIDV